MKVLFIYALLFKSLESIRFFFFKEINSFIQQECIKLIKTLSIYNGTRLYFKEMYFQLVIKVK